MGEHKIVNDMCMCSGGTPPAFQMMLLQVMAHAPSSKSMYQKLIFSKSLLNKKLFFIKQFLLLPENDYVATKELN